MTYHVEGCDDPHCGCAELALAGMEIWHASLADTINTGIREVGSVHAQIKKWDIESLRAGINEIVYASNREIAKLKAMLQDVRTESQAEIERLKAHREQPCAVCWSISWEPIESEEDCALDHPHEGDHIRCGLCWLARNLRAQVERLTEQRDEAYTRGGQLVNRIQELEGNLFQARTQVERLTAALKLFADHCTCSKAVMESAEHDADCFQHWPIVQDARALTEPGGQP